MRSFHRAEQHYCSLPGDVLSIRWYYILRSLSFPQMAGCGSCDCVLDIYFRQTNADFAARRAFEALRNIVADIDIHTLVAPMDLRARWVPTMALHRTRALNPSVQHTAEQYSWYHAPRALPLPVAGGAQDELDCQPERFRSRIRRIHLN